MHRSPVPRDRDGLLAWLGWITATTGLVLVLSPVLFLVTAHAESEVWVLAMYWMASTAPVLAIGVLLLVVRRLRRPQGDASGGEPEGPEEVEEGPEHVVVLRGTPMLLGDDPREATEHVITVFGTAMLLGDDPPGTDPTEDP